VLWREGDNVVEKCLVVHSPPTLIPPLCTWTNNVRDNRESIVGPYFFNNIIGPRKQEWDRSGIRVYNQAFLYIYIRIMIQCHSNVQLFTTLPMWQGGPPLFFEFFYFLKIN
jgi:hypothetical protein